MMIKSVTALVVLLCCIGCAWSDCGLTIPQPSLWCSGDCRATTGTFPLPLPRGEDYNSFYKYILTVLGKDGATVNTRYVNQATTDPNIYFKLKNATNCYLNVTFVYEVASYRNQMGTFKFNKASSTLIDGSKRLLFQESSVDCSGSKSCLPPGSTFTLGPYLGTDNVGFFLNQNRICSSNTYTFYSVDALNPTDRRGWTPLTSTGRMVAVLRDPNTRRVYYGWEDAPTGSDQDYNDNVYSVESNCDLDFTKIPCSADTTCRNDKQVLNTDTCVCECPNKQTCPGAQSWSDDNCACVCLGSQTCTGNFKYNSTSCSCTCPSSPPSGVSCKATETWDTTTCSCRCIAQDPTVVCPNPNYKWNTDPNACGCYCPDEAAAGKDCSALGRGTTTWDKNACNCTCPSSGSCTGNQQWLVDNDPSKCGCYCPSTKPSNYQCPNANYVWDSSMEVCGCVCPAEPPTPCPGNYQWDSTVCDCVCPSSPPTPCVGSVLEWNIDSCECQCPDNDPCYNPNDFCTTSQCNARSGECEVVYTETCAAQQLQYGTTGCLTWECDPSFGCVRKSEGTCCNNATTCPDCALIDGCDWLGDSCEDSGQVLLSPLDIVEHPNCFPTDSGLTPGQTAGITVGIVAGVSVGVGGAAALFGAGYILYRMLNKPPPPEQLPTIENLDAEAGTDDNPLFKKNEVELHNPMFSAQGPAAPGP